MGGLHKLVDTRRKRRIAAIILLSVLALWVLNKYGPSTITPPKLLYVPSGDTARIARSLQEQQINILADELDKITQKKHIISGWIRFDDNKPISASEFADKLLSKKREKTRRVVMYSGDTIHLFVQQLSKQTNLSKDDLLNAYYSYSPYTDGGILAGYYRLPYRLTPEAAMYYMTKSSANQFRKIAAQHGIKYDPKVFRRYLIIASIIQKETWHADEMPLISSVIKNRLDKGIRLQLDATLNYGPFAHTVVTPERIRSDESRFNTYKHKGLPPEPIGSVSKAALQAAIKPAKTNYLFFVRNAQGHHTFGQTYTDHLKNIESTKREKEMLLSIEQNITQGSSPIQNTPVSKETNSSDANMTDTKSQ